MATNECQQFISGERVVFEVVLVGGIDDLLSHVESEELHECFDGRINVEAQARAQMSSTTIVFGSFDVLGNFIPMVDRRCCFLGLGRSR